MAGRGVGLAPEGEGYRGGTELHPRSAPNPLAATAVAQLRARMPPAFAELPIYLFPDLGAGPDI